MPYSIRPARDKDGEAIVRIFNYYVKHTFAAYPEQESGYDFYVKTKQMSRDYAFYIIEMNSDIVGFGLLSPYRRLEVFRRTAQLTYFLLPEHVRKGLGTNLLDILIKKAKTLAVDNLLASVSSINEASIAFHKKNGFMVCGTLKNVGKKFGRDFDVVLMQRVINGRA